MYISLTTALFVLAAYFLNPILDPERYKWGKELKAASRAMDRQRKELEKQLGLDDPNGLTGNELIQLAKSKSIPTWAYENTFRD